MENTKQQILSAEKNQLDSKQVLVECVINLENNENIEKVLALTAHASPLAVETAENQTKFSGEVFLNLFYLTTENQIDSVSSTCDYQDSYKHDSISNEQKIKAEAKIVGVNPVASTEGSLRVLVTVEVGFSVEGNKTLTVFENKNPDCQTKRGELGLNVLSQDVSGEFPCVKTISIKEKVKKVLIVDSSAVIKDVSAGEGFISVQGEVYWFVAYVREDGSITQAQVVESFKEELEVQSASKESTIEANLFVLQKNALLEIEEGETDTALTLTAPLKVGVRVYNTQSFDTVEDIYSLKNALEVKEAQVTNTTLLAPKFFEGKIEGNLTLNENQPRIDKVLAVSSPRYTLSNTYTNDGEVYIEGVVHTNLVYLNDETESINSVEIEVPFVTSEKVSFEEEVSVKTQIALCDCDVIAKRGREIYFDCKIKAYSNFWKTNVHKVISGVEEGKPHAQRDSAIEIYFARTGDTFWDIAKELKVTESLVSGQNPIVMSPLEAGEKIVVYYGLN